VRHISLVDEWRRYANDVRADGKRIGLVPTMGALHAGHASLFRTAKEHGDVVLATIFVNPRQFTNAGDLTRYPRTPEFDVELARSSGVDCVVSPTLTEMWPSAPHRTATTVSVRGVGDTLEGADRPGHFDGVASVVAKLFTITGPSRAYFGEKDFQQIAVLRQMAFDLSFPVEVVSCPIVRDSDGLALSSRNALLSPEGRIRARVLSRALGAVHESPATATKLRHRLRALLDGAAVEVAYADIVDPETFAVANDHDEGVRRAVVAVVIDGVRLIDNGPVTLVRGES
jgi:pantoate--beta-alanine ligase